MHVSVLNIRSFEMLVLAQLNLAINAHGTPIRSFSHRLWKMHIYSQLCSYNGRRKKTFNRISYHFLYSLCSSVCVAVCDFVRNICIAILATHHKAEVPICHNIALNSYPDASFFKSPTEQMQW